MKPDLKIKPEGKNWKLTGNTVVKGMDDTEMLFRIATMTANECISLIGNLSDKELRAIVAKIKEHRVEANIPYPHGSVTGYVVRKHIAKQGWAVA
jgi:Mg/Co/Ni transporter MgtE